MTDQPAPSVRIDRRLRFQHARWLLSCPSFDTPWRQLLRTGCRVTRRRWYAVMRAVAAMFDSFVMTKIGVAIVLVMAIGVLLVLFAHLVMLPSKLLELPPNRIHFDGPSVQVRVALMRLSIGVSALIAVLLLLMPGAKESASSEVNRKAARRVTDPYGTYFWIRPKNLRAQLSILGCFTWITLIGILWDAEGNAFHRCVAIACGAVVIGTICWVTWHAGVRLLRVQCRILHEPTDMTLCKALLCAMIPVTVTTCFWFTSPSSIPISDWLVAFGPVGFAMAQLQSIAEGHWGNLLALFGFAALGYVVGPWITRDSFSWPSIRKSVEAHRTATRDDQGAASSEQTALDRSEDPRAQIALLLEQSIRGRDVRNWRNWFFPLWFRRRAVWYFATLSGVVLIQITLAAIHYVITDLETVRTVGTTVTKTPGEDPFFQCAMPIIFLGMVTEAMALIDRLGASDFGQRPISVARNWCEVQIDGLLRSPLHVLLALPPITIAAFWIDFDVLNDAWKVAAMFLGFLVLVRTTFVAATLFFSCGAIAPKLFAVHQILIMFATWATLFVLPQMIALGIGRELPLGIHGLLINILLVLAYFLLIVATRQWLMRGDDR